MSYKSPWSSFPNWCSCADLLILFYFNGERVITLSYNCFDQKPRRISAPTVLSKTILSVSLVDEELKTWDITPKPTATYTKVKYQANVSMDVKVSVHPWHVGWLVLCPHLWTCFMEMYRCSLGFYTIFYQCTMQVLSALIKHTSESGR